MWSPLPYITVHIILLFIGDSIHCSSSMSSSIPDAKQVNKLTIKMLLFRGIWSGSHIIKPIANAVRLRKNVTTFCCYSDDILLHILSIHNTVIDIYWFFSKKSYDPRTTKLKFISIIYKLIETHCFLISKYCMYFFIEFQIKINLQSKILSFHQIFLENKYIKF